MRNRQKKRGQRSKLHHISRHVLGLCTTIMQALKHYEENPGMTQKALTDKTWIEIFEKKHSCLLAFRIWETKSKVKNNPNYCIVERSLNIELQELSKNTFSRFGAWIICLVSSCETKKACWPQIALNGWWHDARSWVCKSAWRAMDTLDRGSCRVWWGRCRVEQLIAVQAGTEEVVEDADDSAPRTMREPCGASEQFHSRESSRKSKAKRIHVCCRGPWKISGANDFLSKVQANKHARPFSSS